MLTDFNYSGTVGTGQLEAICYEIILEDPTAPQTRCYTTLWNINAGSVCGVVRFLKITLLQIYSCLYQGKNFDIRSVFNEVTNLGGLLLCA